MNTIIIITIRNIYHEGICKALCIAIRKCIRRAKLLWTATVAICECLRKKGLRMALRIFYIHPNAPIT